MSAVPKPTLAQVGITFVPFGLLLSGALLAAEPTLELTRSRAIYTAWASLLLAIPALGLFILPRDNPARATTARLFWTFSFLAYVAHFCYAVLGIYHGSLRELYAGQGAFIATANFIVTALWAYDTVQSWLSDAAGWRRGLSTFTRAAVALTFLVSSVVIFGGIARILGLVMALVMVGCFMIRRRSRGLAPAPVTASRGVVLPEARLP